jgi:hypothetical protein
MSCPKLPYPSPDVARREARNGASGALRPFRCPKCSRPGEAAVYHLTTVSPPRLRRMQRARAARLAAEPIPPGSGFDRAYVADQGDLANQETPTCP